MKTTTEETKHQHLIGETSKRNWKQLTTIQSVECEKTTKPIEGFKQSNNQTTKNKREMIKANC